MRTDKHKACVEKYFSTYAAILRAIIKNLVAQDLYNPRVQKAQP